MSGGGAGAGGGWSGGVLIGTAVQRYETGAGRLASIPQAAGNLVDLEAALTRPGGFFTKGSLALVPNPDKAETVHDAIARLPSRGTVLCYFTGHGLDVDNRLYLALPGTVDTVETRRSTALPVRALLEQLASGPDPNRRVVLILDCCHAGLAVWEEYAADVHLLAAVGKKAKAKYEGAQRNTAFTAALLQALTGGIPDGAGKITLDSLFRFARNRILAALPPDKCPHQRSVDDSGRIALAPNPAFEAVPTPAGFAARQQFARAAGNYRDATWAAELYASLAKDAESALVARSAVVSPAELFDYRRRAAAWRGEAGDPAEAVQQLEMLLMRHPAGVPAQDVALAEQSLAHWRGLAKPGDSARF